MRRSLLNKRILPKPLRQALVLITLLLLPSAAWGITKQYYLYGKDNDKVIGTTSDGSSSCNWTVSGSYDSFNASEDGFTSIRTTSLTLTSEEKFYKIKSVTVDIGAGDWGTGQDISSIEISVNGESPSNTSYNVDHSYSGTASSISTDFKVVTFNNPENENTEVPITIVVSVSGTVDVRIQSIKVEYTEDYGLKIGETALTSDNVDSEGNITGLTGITFTPGNNTLTLNNATIEGDIISQALTINLVGNNTISGKIHPSGYDVSEGELAFTGTENSSLTINASSGSAAIYNYTSVNFGSYKLTTSTSPGVYYNSDYHNLWTNHFGGGGGNAGNVTLTTKTVYPLWIGNSTYTFTQVTEDNKSKILGDSKISFDGNNTLTLSEATLVGSIISGLSGGLTIVVDKENFITMTSTAGDSTLTRIRNIASNASLTIKKSNNEGICSFVVNGPIKNFSSISYENGIYLSSAEDGLGNDLNPAFIYYNYSGGFQYTDNSTIKSLTFSTTKPSESIWIGETQVGEDGSFTGIENVSFDKESKTLTLNGATISNNIISSLPNLTIKLTNGVSMLDENHIISSNPDATLTFTTDGIGSLSSTIGNYNIPWKGFSGNPKFENKLVFTQAAGTEKIEVLSAPTMSYSSGNLTFGRLTDGYTPYLFDCFYSITYEDGGEVSGEYPGDDYDPENPDNQEPVVNMEAKPCTVTAYVTYTDIFENTTISETAIGKYFGFAEPMVLATLASNTEEKELVLPDIVPAIGANDGVTYEITAEGDNIYKNDNNKWMIKGYGEAFLYAQITQETPTTGTPPYTVLNSSSSDAFVSVNVLHEPTFTAYYGENNTQVYNGEGSGNVSVELSCSDLSNSSTGYTLMYYLGTDNTEATQYEEAITLNSTTTVNAFIRYTNSDTDEEFDSEPVSKEFLVSQKLNIPTFEGSIKFQTCYLEDYSLAKPAGLNVYIITEVSLTDNTVKTTSIDYIPMGKAVLLEKDGETPEGGYVAATYTGEEGEFSNNKLYYTDYQIDDLTGTEYVLFNNEFVKATGIIAAGHCYLSLDGPHANTRGFSIDTSGNATTGINNASLHDSREVMTKQWYDLQGRKIQKPTKAGLYIVNGKKVVIK